MDKRFAHILDHQNPFFNDRPWSSLSEAILGFDIQNEGQARSPNRVIANRDWICSRAKLVKPKLSAGILVMTGELTGKSRSVIMTPKQNIKICRH